MRQSMLRSLQVIGFMYTAIVIVIRGTEIVMEREDLSDVKLFRWTFDALFAVPIVVFGFNCHANVVTIFTCATRFLDLPMCLFQRLKIGRLEISNGLAILSRLQI